MPPRTATLTFRSRATADDPFILDLSERVFAAYSRDPVGSTRSMLDEREAEVAVAVRGQTRVGFGILGLRRLHRDVGPWRRPVAAHLDAIAVRPDMHGAGIGGALLDHLVDVALARAAVSLSLLTAESNTRARRLFESAGFLPLLRVGQSYAGGQPGIWMFKPLGG